MNDSDRIYQLLAEANPAPADASPVTRPDADAILQSQRKPTMLTQEPRKLEPATPPRRRTRGPAIALATFVAAVLVGVAVWSLAADDEKPVATGTTAPPTTNTTLPPTTTTVPTTVAPAVVSVPELDGLTLAEARELLAGFGLGIVALPNEVETGIVVAQEPAPGVEVEEGAAVTVDVQVTPTCTVPVPPPSGIGQVTIEVLFECGSDGLFPAGGIPVLRVVPEQGGEAIDRIEWTLRSLLAGPTAAESAAGFTSFFDDTTADALTSVSLTDGHVVADFNDDILVNNASTSTGGMFFNAELRANLFQHPEVDSVEFHLNGDCEAWSMFFQSDGCWVITRAQWEQELAGYEEFRNQ